MNFYKTVHQQSPERKVSRSNQLFLRIIGLYILLAVIGLAFDMAFCHLPEDRIYYVVENKKEQDDRITADLRYYGQKKYYPPQTNSSISRFLKLEIIRNSQEELTVRVIDNDQSRFELPQSLFDTTLPQETSGSFTDLDVQIQNKQHKFELKIYRKNSDHTILNCTDEEFVFGDKYIKWGTKLDSEYLWGLGERNTESFLLKNSGNYTIWNKSQLPGKLDQGEPDHQANGFHPMYLRKEAPLRSWHILLLQTSNAIGISYSYNESLRFQMLGGILCLKLWIGETPADVIEAYHKHLGGYVIPPFWATGFHQSRRGYNSSDALIAVWNQFNTYQLPLDGIWSDVDYMTNFEPFTIDANRYNVSMMSAGMLNQSQSGVKWIPTVPMSIHTEQSIAYNYTGLLIQSGNYADKALIGCGLSGTVYYPDYNNPSTGTQLEYSLSSMMKSLPFDGVQLIGTEPLNLLDGEAVSIRDVKCGIISNAGVNKSNGEYSNFSTIVSKSDLNQRSIPLNAKHYSQDDAVIKAPSTVVDYDFHNLNSFVAGKAAYESLKRLDIRHPLVMSTSTFFGMGKYGGHIVEDSASDFTSLAMSLASIFNFQLFGMPFAGVDICGKEGNASPQLCARWMALGSMYPFARNHNSQNTSSQQPYAFSEPYVLEASLRSLRLRYSLLKYYYSVYAITYGVGTVFSPLFVEFPEDPECLTIQTQAMIGPALLITPVLIPAKIGNTTSIKPYFPAGTWFSIQNPDVRFEGGSARTFNVSFNESCPTFIREGHLVIYQDTQLKNGSNITRTYQLDNRFTLLIALRDSEFGYEAEGFLVSISNYSEYMDRCVETEEDCVIEVHCKGKWQSTSNLELTVAFDVELIDTFTDLIVEGLKVYVRNFKTKQVQFDEPRLINPDIHDFTEVLSMEELTSSTGDESAALS